MKLGLERCLEPEVSELALIGSGKHSCCLSSQPRSLVSCPWGRARAGVFLGPRHSAFLADFVQRAGKRHRKESMATY